MKLSKGLIVLAYLISGVAYSEPKYSFVFEGKNAVELTKPCSRDKVEGITSFWKPTEQQIAALETKFDKCVQGKSLKKLSAYTRQYAGIMREKEKFIYLSAVAKEEGSVNSANPKPIGLCDGGTLAFGVEYDVNRSEFQKFAFNGTIAGSSGDSVSLTCGQTK